MNEFWCMSDIETSEWNKNMETGDKLEVRLICAIFYKNNDEIERYSTQSVKEFIDFILDFKKRHNISTSFRIYYHNSRFDVKFLLNELNDRKFEHRIIFASARLLKLSVYFKSKIQFEIIDSLSILTASVKKLGSMMDSKKLDMHSTELEVYCFRDCEIIAKSLMRFSEFLEKFGIDKDVSNLNITIASNAFNLCFVKNAQFNAISSSGKKYSRMVLLSKEMNGYFREFYFGGRTEVFNFNILRNGCERDFCSRYPATMIENLFPLTPYHYYETYETIDVILQNKLMFALECDIDESNREIPCFPERIEIDNANRCMFRACKKHVLLFRKEIEYCLSHNIPIIKIKEVWECAEFGNIFAYMKEMYEMRKELRAIDENDYFVYLIKIFMNSTYGKFAERDEKENTVLLQFDAVDYQSRSVDLEQHGFRLIAENGMSRLYSKKEAEKYSMRQNCCIAAMITAYSRLSLQIEMETIKFAEIFYVDTDSIFSSDTNFVSSTELGCMKKEFDCETFIAINNKCYLAYTKKEHIVKAKGMSNASELSILFEKDRENIYVRPASIKECIRRKIDYTAVVRVNKHYEGIYDKRKINDDFTTSAWSEDEKVSEYRTINKQNYLELVKRLIKFEKGGKWI